MAPVGSPASRTVTERPAMLAWNFSISERYLSRAWSRSGCAVGLVPRSMGSSITVNLTGSECEKTLTDRRDGIGRVEDPTPPTGRVRHRSFTARAGPPQRCRSMLAYRRPHST